MLEDDERKRVKSLLSRPEAVRGEAENKWVTGRALGNAHIFQEKGSRNQ